MSNQISTNYAPSISNTLTPNASSKANATTTSSDGGAYSASNIGSTFLNLLVQELQNQDPTAPMDSTAMVGQMISLNQLDQLIGINKGIGTSSTSSSSSDASTKQAVSNVLNADATPASSQTASAAQTALANPYLAMSQTAVNNDLAQQQSLSAFSVAK